MPKLAAPGASPLRSPAPSRRSTRSTSSQYAEGLVEAADLGKRGAEEGGGARADRRRRVAAGRRDRLALQVSKTASVSSSSILAV